MRTDGRYQNEKHIVSPHVNHVMYFAMGFRYGDNTLVQEKH